MHPRLIVDFSERSFCAFLATPEGQFLPCSHKVRGVDTRQFSSEILFDPRPFEEDPDFDWEEVLESLAKGGARNLFQRARRLGLRRPWDPGAPAESLRLLSPLAVLSSPAALADPEVRLVLPKVAVGLLDALLDPVFTNLAQRDFAIRDTEAFVTLPANAGRRACLALHKVFRRRGFRHLKIVPREIAAAMALIEQPPARVMVWDVTGSNLHLYHVTLQPDGDMRRFRTVAARTVQGLGWSYWVRQIATALAAQGRIPDPPGPLLPALDRALTGLLSGSPDSPELPTSPPLRLTHDLLDEILESALIPELLTELYGRLEPHLEALAIKGLPVILLGAVCNLRSLQKLFLMLADGTQPEEVAQTRVQERAARGIAAALQWSGERDGGRVEILPDRGLRLNTFHGETWEILSAERIPHPGEGCHMQQSFHFAGDCGTAGPFLVHLLWGTDPTPEGSSSLCALPLEIEASQGGELRLIVSLKRSSSGRRLGVAVEATFGSGEAGQTRVRAFCREVLEVLLATSQGEVN